MLRLLVSKYNNAACWIKNRRTPSRRRRSINGRNQITKGRARIFTLNGNFKDFTLLLKCGEKCEAMRVRIYFSEIHTQTRNGTTPSWRKEGKKKERKGGMHWDFPIFQFWLIFRFIQKYTHTSVSLRCISSK